ncbi:MAG: hypothetical protein U0744_05770 [Gemmataceae bacterium]
MNGRQLVESPPGNGDLCLPEVREMLAAVSDDDLAAGVIEIEDT